MLAKQDARTITPPETQEMEALAAKAKADRGEIDTLKAAVLEKKQKLDHLEDANGARTTEYGAFFEQFKGAGHQKFDALDAAFVGSIGMTGGDEAERFSGYFGAIATQIHAMETGRGALLNICRRSGSGHFAAFHRSTDGGHWNSYDPNLGWYQCGSAEEVGTLFRDLFLSVYANKQYEEANWIEVTAA